MNEHVLNMLYLVGGILICAGIIIGGAVVDRRAARAAQNETRQDSRRESD